MHRTTFRFFSTVSLALFVSVLVTVLLTGCSDRDPLEKIRALQERHAYADTVEPLRELLEVQPSDPETNFLYGRALVYTQQPELALFSLREAMRDPDWKERAGLEVAVACLITGDYNQAIEATTELLVDDPDNVDALLLRAQARAHWRNDPPLALEDAERALELDPEKVEAYEPLILSLLALDQPLEARERLAEAGRLVATMDVADHVLAWHCTTSATLALDMGETDKAEEEFDQCVRRYPGATNIVQNSVEFFDEKGMTDRSLEILRAAVVADPKSRTFRTSLATRLVGIGEVEEAEKMMLAATDVKDATGSARAWSDLADLYNMTGDYKKAADALQRANEKVQGSDPGLAFRYADALIFAEEYDKALEHAATLNIESYRALIEARVAQVRGDNEKALEGFLRASQLWPDNPVSRYYAAYSAEQLGRFNQALEEYRYAIRIDSSATDARTRVAKILIAQGNLSGAYNLLFVKAVDHPLEPEGWILGSELIARVSNASQLQDHLLQLAKFYPAAYPQGLVHAAEGLDKKGLADGGVELLYQPPHLDWRSDAAFPVVEKLVRLAHKADRVERARDFLEMFRKAAPDATDALEEAETILFELGGGPTDQVRARWLALTERAPNRPGPWAALGNLDRESDPSKALEYYDRALELDPTRKSLQLDRAQVLAALDRIPEAAAVLEQRLEEEPTDARAAALRVELDLRSNTVTERTADWARRASRFGRKPEDFERLASVHRALGNEAEAIAAEEAALGVEAAEQASPDKSAEPS